MANRARHEEPAREYPAVKTTIVGGRPPGCGQEVGDIPRGIEVLMKKASVDPAFRRLLMKRRSRAAEAIGLALAPVEASMIDLVPASQLQAIIAATRVEPAKRSAFLGKAAAVMLVALGASGGDGSRSTTARAAAPAGDGTAVVAQADPGPVEVAGARATVPPASQPATATAPAARADDPQQLQIVKGIRSDRPIVVINEDSDSDVSVPPTPVTATQPASVPALTAEQKEQIARLLKEMDSDKYVERDAAHKKLEAMGPAVIPALREAIQSGKHSLEVQSRVQTILDKLSPPSRPDRVMAQRGIRAVDVAGIRAAPPLPQPVPEKVAAQTLATGPAATQASRPASTQASQPATQPVRPDEVRPVRGVRADLPLPSAGVRPAEPPPTE